MTAYRYSTIQPYTSASTKYSDPTGYFTALQASEYLAAPFTIADSACGSTFFVATGFHGLDVIIGTTFLTTCLLGHTTLHFSSNHHFGSEAAACYWSEK
jgi:cytochrome c oxidase subunit 3